MKQLERRSLNIFFSIYEMIHIWTAVVDESKVWSSQLIFQFKQLEGRSLKKSGLQREFEPVTSAIPVRCSTNWAMKPHIGSEVNLLNSYISREAWNDVKYVWNDSYGLGSFPFVLMVRITRLLWRMVIYLPMMAVFWGLVSVCVYWTCVGGGGILDMCWRLVSVCVYWTCVEASARDSSPLIVKNKGVKLPFVTNNKNISLHLHTRTG